MLLGIAVLSCAAAGVSVLSPWPLKLLVDCALGGEAAPEWVSRISAALGLGSTTAALVAFAAVGSLIVYLLGSVADAGLAFGWTAAGQRMVYDLAGDLFARLQRLSLLFHGKTPVGDSLSRLSGDAWCVYTVCEGVLVAPVQHIVTLALVGSVAWRLDPKLAGVAFAVAPLLGASAYFFGRRLRRATKVNREAQARLASFVHTTLGAIPLVQAFGAERRNVQTYQRLAGDAVRSTRRGLVLKQVYAVVNTAAATVGTAVVLYLGGRRVLEGAMTLGSLLVFLAYLRTIQAASQGLLSVYGNVKGVEASIDRVSEVLDVEVGVTETADAQPLPPCRPGGAEIRWENVSFGYDAGAPVLKEVTLEVKPGQMLAVVGPTGAGKSTLVSLVPRFFDPWSGRVLIDGQDLRLTKLAELRARVSIVLQEPFLLPLSVADNIAYGRPGAGREEIQHAAIAANADAFIRALPQGYDTVIGERGASLSGGERQRLAIARAIWKDAPILILDEPTASLDAETEASVMGALERLTAGRTTIVIAHRLSTVRRASAVAVIEGGKVAEFGTHDELMRKGGLYRRLNDLQFGPQPRAGVLV
ncbi:MAG: ABC-type multidrug transport system, ATPase and permease component [Phycisphaerales bacterium]|nr:ABC-type multidrug transport system, ATPase and permease component [Phycisphaerales bacterium]